TFNSPFYPATTADGGPGPRIRLINQRDNQMVLGVSDNVDAGSEDYAPKATQQMIVRKRSLAPPNAPQDESATKMGWVRIRNSVTLCTQSYFDKNGYELPHYLTETTDFSNYCSSSTTYEP
ncbi:MAG: hypothetical protein ABI041_16990, partial [Bdellovibrionia bacterium]